jgi:hypothetical protein
LYAYRLGKLDGAGLIRRMPNPDDQRAALVEATERGRETSERVRAARTTLVTWRAGPTSRCPSRGAARRRAGGSGVMTGFDHTDPDRASCSWHRSGGCCRTVAPATGRHPHLAADGADAPVRIVHPTATQHRKAIRGTAG